MTTPSQHPVVIEVAITPLRWDAPAQTVETMITEANACIEPGAGIVDHHHCAQAQA